MKEKYEQLHILLLIAWLVTREVSGYLIIFPFMGMVFLILHIIVTQMYYEKQKIGKGKIVLQVFHYTFLTFVYVCIISHFIWRLINVI